MVESLDPRLPVLLPAELIPATPEKEQALEDYVHARILQFSVAFANRINPQLNLHLVQRAATETIASLPRPVKQPSKLEFRDLQLVFRHDCLSLGCLDSQCVLCEHNPHRRCNVNFAAKYLVHDPLKAKCDASIRVEIIDRLTGAPVVDNIPDVHLEMCILDGNAYDAKCQEPGSEREEDLEACALLTNNKQQPLLVSGQGGQHNQQSKVIIPLTNGVVSLPDLHVSDSSEAMLSGRKPPFRLLIKAVHSGGSHIHIRHAVSEGFVVATRRTRTAGKVEIPNVDDHVSKLEHMGKETVKKLQDLRTAAMQCGVEIDVPENCINKVGQFRKLATLAEADGHLRQRLQQILKLSKEKWEEARDHAMRAVVADNRMRIWYADDVTMEVGLLFTCRLGNIDLDRPAGLLQKKGHDDKQTTMEATLTGQQTPAQREQVRALLPQAVGSWWAPGHPGWAIHPVDSEQFMGPVGSSIPVVRPQSIPSPAPRSPHVGQSAHPGLPPSPPPSSAPQLPPSPAPTAAQPGVQLNGLPGASNPFDSWAGGAISAQQLLAFQQLQQHLQPRAGNALPPEHRTTLDKLAAAMQGPAATSSESLPRSPTPPSSSAAIAPPPVLPLDLNAIGTGNLSVFQSLLPPASIGQLATFPNVHSPPDFTHLLNTGASYMGLPYSTSRLPSLGKLDTTDMQEGQDASGAIAMLHDIAADAAKSSAAAPSLSLRGRSTVGLESLQSMEAAGQDGGRPPWAAAPQQQQSQ